VFVLVQGRGQDDPELQESEIGDPFQQSRCGFGRVKSRFSASKSRYDLDLLCSSKRNRGHFSAQVDRNCNLLWRIFTLKPSRLQSLGLEHNLKALLSLLDVGIFLTTELNQSKGSHIVDEAKEGLDQDATELRHCPGFS
jgi:hypothetical protein